MFSSLALAVVRRRMLKPHSLFRSQRILMLQIRGWLDSSYLSFCVAALPRCHIVSLSSLNFSAVDPCLRTARRYSRSLSGKESISEMSSKFVLMLKGKITNNKQVPAISQHLGSEMPSWRLAPIVVGPRCGPMWQRHSNITHRSLAQRLKNAYNVVVRDDAKSRVGTIARRHI